MVCKEKGVMRWQSVWDAKADGSGLVGAHARQSIVTIGVASGDRFPGGPSCGEHSAGGS